MELDGGEVGHIGVIVTAEDAVDIIFSLFRGEVVGSVVVEEVLVGSEGCVGAGEGAVIGVSFVGADEMAGVAVFVAVAADAGDGADGIEHGGVVAAEEGGVNHAAIDVHRGVGAVDEVAAAIEVADAEVVAVASEDAVVIVVVSREEFGVVNVNEDCGGVGHGATDVVAAEDREEGAAVDVNGDAVFWCFVLVGGDADKGVASASEEGVDDDVVVVMVSGVAVSVEHGARSAFGDTDGDVCRLDVGDSAVTVIAGLGLVDEVGSSDIEGCVVKLMFHHGSQGTPCGSIFVDAVGIGGAIHIAVRQRVPRVDLAVEVVGLVAQCGTLLPEIRIHVLVERFVIASVDTLVGVVAVAAAVDVADVDGVDTIGEGGADLEVGSFVALHPSGDVIATVERGEGVGAVDDHLGAAADVSHASAAEDGSTHHGSLGGIGVA